MINDDYLLKLFEMFLDNLPFAVWIEDLNFRVLYLNKLYERFYDVRFCDAKGKTNDEAFGKDLADIYNRQIKQCLDNDLMEVVQGDVNGTIVECYIFPIKNKSKKTVAVAGFIIDISERKARETEIENQKNLLRTIIDALPEAIFYKDKESRLLGYNKKFEEFYIAQGVTEILGKNDLELYKDKEVAKEFIRMDKKIMEAKKAKYYEQTISDLEKGRRVEEVVKIPVFNKKNHVWGIVGLARDITERKNMEEKLRYLSETDMLTKLYNRYSFEEKSKALDMEENFPLGIIMGDVNGLKLVNDSLGHLEGDKVLISISEILKNVCFGKGYVFRWGGDEFVMLIPNASEEACEKIIEKINYECSQKKHEFLQLSMALAAEVKNTNDITIYDCIKIAEQKLYSKKLLEKKSIKSSIIESLKASLQEKSLETKEHTDRVTKYALKIGKILKLKESQLDELVLAAELHDIGKIAISEEILLKKGRLTEEEFEIMKTHTEKGYRIINASLKIENVAKCVLSHHERYDGTGYPFGIKGKDIPIIARIINLADSYDVMTHARVYKNPISKKKAIEEIRKCSGTQFDPEIVEYFIKNISEIE